MVQKSTNAALDFKLSCPQMKELVSVHETLYGRNTTVCGKNLRMRCRKNKLHVQKFRWAGKKRDNHGISHSLKNASIPASTLGAPASQWSPKAK